MRRPTEREIIVTLTCPDQVGIVQVVSGFLAERGINIVESQQFADRTNNRFFIPFRRRSERPNRRCSLLPNSSR